MAAAPTNTTSKIVIVSLNGSDEKPTRMKIDLSGTLSYAQVGALNRFLREKEATLDQLNIYDSHGNEYTIGRAFAGGSIYQVVQNVSRFPQMI